MRRALLVAAALVVLSLTTSRAGSCAELVGVVADTEHHPVGGVEITATGNAGKVFAMTKTTAQGRYAVSKLPEGNYKFTLDAHGLGFKNGEALAYLGPKGLTINWMLSSTNPALALASEGAEVLAAGDPFGYSDLEFTAMVGGIGGVATGGVLGGIAAAGGFSGGGGGGPSGPPASPAR